MSLELCHSVKKLIIKKYALKPVIKGVQLIDSLIECAETVTGFNCLCSEYKDSVINDLCKLFVIKNDNPRFYQSLHD